MKTSPLISNLAVKRLFGSYDYAISLEEGKDAKWPKLSILYGDNGCGKTTILRLLFHTLSPGRGRGHRTELCRIPFEEFKVSLGDGTEIKVSKPKNHLVGSFTMSVQKQGKERIDGQFQEAEIGKLQYPLDPNAEQLLEAHTVPHL